MVKISIISGFLGAGKTTLIKKMLDIHAFGAAPVLVENDYGALGIDSQMLKSTGVQVLEMTAGCICCSLAGNFVIGIEELIRGQEPEQLIIEPSGAGRLSEILEALRELRTPYERGPVLTVVDALRFEQNDRYVNEYFWNQITHGDAVVLTRTERLSEEALEQICGAIRAKRAGIPILPDPSPEQLTPLLQAGSPHSQASEGSGRKSVSPRIRRMGNIHASLAAPRKRPAIPIIPPAAVSRRQGGFQSWSMEIPVDYDEGQLREIIDALEHRTDCGTIVRAKGILRNSGQSVLLNYVPGEGTVSPLSQKEPGRVMVIGCDLNVCALRELFSI